MIQGVLTVAGRNAIMQYRSGLTTAKDQFSYFVFGEGGALIGTVGSEAYATTTLGVKTYAHTLAHIPCVRGSLTVSDSHGNTATDNGNALLSCSAFTGMVNYATGVVTITYNTAPTVGTTIAAAYQYRYGGKVPNPAYTETEGEASPSDPHNPSHLAFYKKLFFADSTSTITFTPGNPPFVVCTLFLDLFEFLDNGIGETPWVFEIGVYDTEGVLLAYATIDPGIFKDGSTQILHTGTFYA